MKKFLRQWLIGFLLALFLVSGTGIFRIPQTTAAAETSSSVLSAPASSGYACILSDETYFYTSPDERRGAFLLPKTYYVRVLEYGATFCRVEYLYDDTNVRKLSGYAKTSDLTFVEYVPQTPYLYYLFDVNYRIDESFVNDSAFLDTLTVTCAYYGDYKIGSETYCYVLRGDTFGYVPKPVSLYFPLNPEYDEYLARIEQENASAEQEKKDEATSDSSPAQIAILVALCLLVPVLAALILKPPRRPPYEAEE
ncbi:MAG: hypothetical protein IJV85_02550 [Clostridia bacterium]|nr:hypothetical protein [Clostridia bacterium]